MNVPNWASNVVERYRRSVSQLLGLPPGHINFVFGDNSSVLGSDGNPVPMYTSGDTITINKDFVNEYGSDEATGALVHEMTHAYMHVAAPSGAKWGWFTEGVADWVRDELGLSTTLSHAHRGNPRGGYQETAHFFRYINRRAPGSIAAVANAMSTGTYDQSKTWTEMTGLSLPSLVQNYDDRVRGGLTPGAPLAEPTGAATPPPKSGSGSKPDAFASTTSFREGGDYVNPASIRGLAISAASAAGSPALIKDVARNMRFLYEKNIGKYTAHEILGQLATLTVADDGSLMTPDGKTITPAPEGWKPKPPPKTDPKSTDTTTTTSTTPVDSNGNGIIDFDEYLAANPTTTDKTSIQDFLSAAVGSGIPITTEIRELAKKAAQEGWTSNEFTTRLSQTKTYFKDQSMTYKAQLQGYGMDFSDPNLTSLMHDAVAGAWTQDEFLFKLRKTPEYHKEFAGIFDKHGDMRMSEADYITFKTNLTHLGATYGFKPVAHDIGQILDRGMDITQVEDRLAALQRVEQYKPAMQAFKATLEARGALPPGSKDWTKQEQLDFVMGKSNPIFYQIWEEASAATAADTAGLNVLYKGEHGDSYTDIHRKQLLRVINRIPGYQSEGDLAAGFDKAASDMLNLLPLSEARAFGLTKRDILAAQFGGKGSQKAKQKIQRVINTNEAFGTDMANRNTYVDQSGHVTVQGANRQKRDQSAG